MVKGLLDKTLKTGESFREAFFALQNTLRTAEGLSPARLFYGRIVRSPKLPQLQDGQDERADRDIIQAKRDK